MSQLTMKHNPKCHALKTGFIVLALTAAGTVSGQAGQDGLTVENGTLRVVTIQRPAAGFFDLVNNGTQDQTLVGASSPVCKKAMLHQTKMVDGVMKMRPVKELTVTPGTTLSFAPGGYHIMCMHPVAGIKSEKTVPVTLKFKNGTTLQATFKVTGVR
jgi:copper(I)-binding protein